MCKQTKNQKQRYLERRDICEKEFRFDSVALNTKLDD